MPDSTISASDRVCVVCAVRVLVGIGSAHKCVRIYYIHMCNSNMAVSQAVIRSLGGRARSCDWPSAMWTGSLLVLGQNGFLGGWQNDFENE